jgi:hypothetical protein
MSKETDFDIKFSYPEGWLQLPVTASGDEPESGKDLEQWAADTARATLGPDAPADLVQERATELASLTLGSRARQAWYGLAYFPAGAPGLVALLDVLRLVPDPDYPEITLDLVQGMYAKDSADAVGELETSRTELPSGPAVRIRAKQIDGRDPTGQGTLMEGVTHAIRPPGTRDAVITQMSWTALPLGEKLAEMADAIAGSITVTSV